MRNFLKWVISVLVAMIILAIFAGVISIASCYPNIIFPVILYFLFSFFIIWAIYGIASTIHEKFFE